MEYKCCKCNCNFESDKMIKVCNENKCRYYCKTYCPDKCGNC